MSIIVDSKFGGFYVQYQRDLQTGLQKLPFLDIDRVVKTIKSCSGTIWLIGNGGSASLADHMAVDLQLAGKRAIALTSAAAITTYANDRAFIFCFREQLKAVARPGDYLICISGSGESADIIAAAEWAMQSDMIVVSLVGFAGRGIPHDYQIHIPVNHMGVVQDLQQVVLHIICYWLMEEGKK